MVDAHSGKHISIVKMTPSNTTFNTQESHNEHTYILISFINLYDSIISRNGHINYNYHYFETRKNTVEIKSV